MTPKVLDYMTTLLLGAENEPRFQESLNILKKEESALLQRVTNSLDELVMIAACKLGEAIPFNFNTSPKEIVDHMKAKYAKQLAVIQ